MTATNTFFPIVFLCCHTSFASSRGSEKLGRFSYRRSSHHMEWVECHCPQPSQELHAYQFLVPSYSALIATKRGHIISISTISVLFPVWIVRNYIFLVHPLLTNNNGGIFDRTSPSHKVKYIYTC